MKKRIVSFVLALIMLVGLVPTAALTARAATNSVSKDMIEVIKEREGFSAKAYKDNTQWSIGYGTKSEEGATITKEEAEEALLKELAEVDAAVNKFASANGLSFSQSKHDALVSFTYNCGSGWMDGGRFCSAVTSGATGNDFLFAITLWSNSGGSVNKGLLDRRLSEANTYLNGVYAVSRPSNYAYVFFNANGGSVGEEKVQGYDSSTKDGAPIKVTPTWDGHLFGGWYTEAEGGTLVSALDASMAGKTLYAHWDEIIATVKVTNSYINVRAKASASASSTIVGKVYQGDTLVLVEVSEDGKWGRFEDGWVALEYTNYKDVIAGKAEDDKTEDEKDEESKDDEVVEETVIATGTVANCTTLKIRKSASTTSAQVGSLQNGAKVSFYEFKRNVNGHDWGRIDKGWICLTYVAMDSDAEDSTTGEESNTAVSATTTIATVSSKDGANVRKEADVDSDVVETLKEGTEITITETKTVNGQNWGKTDKGWVLMSLVTVKQVITNYRLGYVDNTDKVNVRAAAGTNKALVGTLARGTEVKIYDETTKNGVKWYQIDQGWVCGTYITLADASDDSSSDDTTVSGDAIAVGLVNSNINLNVRKGPGTNYDKVSSLPNGTRINIYKITKTNGIEWGQTEDGWVCMTYVTVIAGSTSEDETPSGEGTTGTVVNCSTAVNIRAAAGVNNALVGTAALGSTVTIYETTTVNGVEWGRMDRGWVCMTYIRLNATTGGSSSDDTTSDDTTTGGSTGTENAQTGTIANTNSVNVRAAAGVSNALVTTLARGTKVNVYEQVTKDGAAWGRIDQGWVAMQYVALDTTTGGSTSSGSTETAIGTGYVNSSVDLNVRSGPGLGYAKVTSLKSGTQVTVYEQLTSDGMIWGRIDQGWVCMSYVTLTSTVSTGKGVMGTIARCGNAVNVRSAPGTGNALVGTILVGSRVEILETKDYNGQEWGRVTQGWISMYYVLLDSELPPAGDYETDDSTGTGTDTEDSTTTEEDVFSYDKVTASGTVTYAEGANVRETPNGTVVATLENGAKVLITEQKTDDNKDVWGRTEKGWVLMSRITLDAEITGTILAETNVRKGPNTGFAVVKTLAEGTKVTVVAQTTINGEKWGKTADGWVLMASVKADEDGETEDKSDDSTEDKSEDAAEGETEDTSKDTTEEKSEGTEGNTEGSENVSDNTTNQTVDWE